MVSQKFSQTHSINSVFDFLHSTFIFSFTFYNETCKFFPCKTAYFVKRKHILKEKFAFEY
jgi:hypothetical protein